MSQSKNKNSFEHLMTNDLGLDRAPVKILIFIFSPLYVRPPNVCVCVSVFVCVFGKEVLIKGESGGKCSVSVVDSSPLGLSISICHFSSYDIQHNIDTWYNMYVVICACVENIAKVWLNLEQSNTN